MHRASEKWLRRVMALTLALGLILTRHQRCAGRPAPTMRSGASWMRSRSSSRRVEQQMTAAGRADSQADRAASGGRPTRGDRPASAWRLHRRSRP